MKGEQIEQWEAERRRAWDMYVEVGLRQGIHTLFNVLGQADALLEERDSGF